MTLDWISFDLYSSLIDTTLGLRTYFRRLLQKKGVPVPPEEIAKVFPKVHNRMLLASGFRRYRELLNSALEETLRDCKVSFTPEDGAALATAMGLWRPYDEVVIQLPRFQKLAKIAIVANADTNFTTRSCSYLGIAPNLIITSEDVRSYKPSGKIFVAALARMYAPSENVLHVSTEADIDIVPAHKLGFKTAYLRRSATPAPVKPDPDYDVPSLFALAARIGAPADTRELPPWSTLDDRKLGPDSLH